jgi:hypothetical protein
MDQQIKDMFEKAFWDKLDDDTNNNNLEHVIKLLNEIKHILKSFTPNRIDIHNMIDNDITNEVCWDTQEKLVNWLEKFQAPIHDKCTRQLKTELPLKLSDFLKRYYEHMTLVHKEVFEYRKKLANNENIFQSTDVKSSGNNVPDKIKTGLL